MDRINEGPFDQMIDDAIRCEPLVETPFDFSQLFLEQLKIEAEKPKFEVLSWVDLISSMIIAVTIGTAFLIPALLPEHLSPLMQWFLQWGEYWLTKALFSLPGIILTIGGIVFAIGVIIAISKGIAIYLNKRKLQRIGNNNLLV